MSSENGQIYVNGVNGRSASHHLNGFAQPACFSYDDEQRRSAEQIAAIWQRRAEALAIPLHVASEGTTLELLVFSLGGKRYGIKVNHVREIYPLRQITPVPRTPEFVVGVFSARGRLLSVIDLHAFLCLPRASLAHNSKIIVIASEDQGAGSKDEMELGLLADEVENVLTLFEDDLTPMVSSLNDSQVEFTLGVTADMLVVLNLETLLNNKRLIIHEEI